MIDYREILYIDEKEGKDSNSGTGILWALKTWDAVREKFDKTKHHEVTIIHWMWDRPVQFKATQFEIENDADFQWYN